MSNKRITKKQIRLSHEIIALQPGVKIALEIMTLSKGHSAVAAMKAFDHAETCLEMLVREVGRKFDRLRKLGKEKKDD